VSVKSMTMVDKLGVLRPRLGDSSEAEAAWRGGGKAHLSRILYSPRLKHCCVCAE
jgi:hypothetical protein